MERKIDSTLHVRLKSELRERLEELAEREEMPLSIWVRRALREAARRQQTEAA